MAETKGNPNYGSLKRQQYLSLTDIAYNTLLEAIINQDFEPDAPVSIDNLAKQLNMSNTPVREALMRAHGEGLVTQKTNHGFVVATILTPDEFRQLFEVRHLLEVHALSTGEIRPEAVEAAANLVQQMVATGDGTVFDDYREYMALDQQFHRVLVGLGGNKFLVDIWEDLHVHLQLSRLYMGVGLFDRGDSIKEHQVILDALRQSDQQAAMTLLSQHIKQVGKRIQSFFHK